MATLQACERSFGALIAACTLRLNVHQLAAQPSGRR
jgi:hypothetical protein